MTAQTPYSFDDRCDIETRYYACVSALRDFCETRNFTDVVIGLSGGMDSAMVAVMALDALGADHVHCVLLPGPFSTEHSLADAHELASRLAIATKTISISETFDVCKNTLEHCDGGTLSNLTGQNIQARLRTVYLMALSNEYGWIMLNTGNKSEAYMGYSTLYGDTAGAFAPLGGLYKTDIFAMARWLNAKAASCGAVEPIPEHIITKAPSAELAPDQEDEKSLGVTYEILDSVLLLSVDKGLCPEEIVACGIDAASVELVLARAQRMEFKRLLEPPSPDFKFY